MIGETLRGARTNTFRSLRIRNYRLYFIGQMVALAGTWMKLIAQALLVVDLADSNGVAVGAVVALQFLPTLMFGVFAGVIVDRFEKRPLLIACQALMAVNVLVFGLLTIADVIELWMVYALVFAHGMVNTLDLPLRQTFVSEMVGEDDLPNAVALNSAVFNGARIVGPALAALVLLVADEGACFLVNSASYLVAIWCMSMMRTSELHPSATIAKAKGQIREGMSYVWSNHQVRYITMLVGIFGMLAFTFNVSLPLMAKVVFDDKKVFTIMTIAMGIGSLIGALLTAAREVPTTPVLVTAAAGFSITNVAAGFSPSLSLMLPLLALMGFCSISFLATANSIVQMSVAPAMRGRVMALYTMVLMGGTPIGNVAAGWVAELLNPRWSMAMGGIGTGVGVMLLGKRIPRPTFTGEVIDDLSVVDEATVISN